MIDPFKITNFNRNNAELQEFLMFCIMVAGKRASMISLKLENLIQDIPFKNDYLGPLERLAISRYDNTAILKELCLKHKTGQYTKIVDSFERMSKDVLFKKIDLKTCLPQDLEKYKGIGPKTSRFFILHSRENANYAVLDTHILHWMRDLGIDTPKSTPTIKKYYELEKIFLDKCNDLKVSPAKLDLEIWKKYTKSKEL